jgi:hypothetical protein
MALEPSVEPWPPFPCLDSFTQTVGLLGRGISPLQGRYLHTEQHKHRINAHRHPCLKWESNPHSVFDRARTVHALDRAATVIGKEILLTYGAHPFLRSCQLCSPSGTSQHFKEPEGLSPCSQEP